MSRDVTNRRGKSYVVTSADEAVKCSLCGAVAVVPLSPSQVAAQPDDTTHVCHPGLGGCNHGFAGGAS